jgi:hypothetical protein
MVLIVDQASGLWLDGPHCASNEPARVTPVSGTRAGRAGHAGFYDLRRTDLAPGAGEEADPHLVNMNSRRLDERSEIH